MPEQIQRILKRIADWWKKFNNKQRALLISALAVVLIALGILSYAVSRPNYVTVYTASTMKEASSVATLLSDNSIKYNTIGNGMVFQVDKKSEANACYLLAENDYPSETYSIANVTGGSFSTTESDRQKLYKDFLEKKFADHLSSFDFIDYAMVDITLPNEDGTILSSEANATAAVQLKLKNQITDEQCYGIALFVGTEIGNGSADGVTVLDTEGNVLYSSNDNGSTFGTSTTQQSNTNKLVTAVQSQVSDVLTGTQMFGDIHVGVTLAVNYADKTVATHEYYGRDEDSNTNMIDSISEYNAESNAGSEAIPGTDSNGDDTTYYIDSNGNSYYTVADSSIKYLTNERISEEKSSGAEVNYKNSTIAVVATQYLVYKEELLEKSGDLDEMTFEEFKATHSDVKEIQADDSFIDLVSKTTSIPTENISFKVYQQPVFEAKEVKHRSTSDIFQIVLAVLIFILLGYVVFRSTRKSKDLEAEPELSVETLLEATGEEKEPLDDIGYSEKSETRILIEKFVDENPDAVALLLRNWLNEDWD